MEFYSLPMEAQKPLNDLLLRRTAMITSFAATLNSTLNISTLRKDLIAMKRLFLKFALLFSLISVTVAPAQTVVAPKNGATGCMVEGNIYWDRLGTSNTFRFADGTFTPWSSKQPTYYAEMLAYACSYAPAKDKGSCSVIGKTRGVIVTFKYVQRPVNNALVPIGITICLYLTFLYHRRKAQGPFFSSRRKK